MELIKQVYRTLTLLSIILVVISVSAGPPPGPATQYEGYGTPEKGRHVVQCLLGLIWRITPYVMLALLLQAGIRIIAAGDDKAGRVMGKKHIKEAIIGFMCVVGLLAIATFLGIPPIPDCFQNEPEPPITPGGAPSIICPDGTVVTATGVC